MVKVDELIKEGNIQECCVNCRNFALWDGDFCCVANMEIMQFGDEFDDSILKTIKTPETCDQYEKDEKYNTSFFEELLKKHIGEK